MGRGRAVLDDKARRSASLLLSDPRRRAKIDAGEDIRHTAIRELREETGYSAREWARAGVFHNACAYTDEGIEIRFARGLVAGRQDLDAGEFVETVECTAAEVLARVLSGEITDMKTALGALWLNGSRSEGWSLNWQPAP